MLIPGRLKYSRQEAKEKGKATSEEDDVSVLLQGCPFNSQNACSETMAILYDIDVHIMLR
jgi:hypothetical protein